MVPDARVFSSMQNEQKYPWLYDSVVHQGYLCKFCELFCGHSSSSQEFVTVQSALNPTCLLQVNDFPTHLYLGFGSLIFGKISA
jgi:hypothetical protein